MVLAKASKVDMKKVPAAKELVLLVLEPKRMRPSQRPNVTLHLLPPCWGKCVNLLKSKVDIPGQAQPAAL